MRIGKFSNFNVTSSSTSCQRCGQLIRWSDSGKDEEDEQFDGIISKLRHHIKNDVACNRIAKLDTLFGENKKLAQDYHYNW
jgi:hypothetical protein